MLLIFYKGNKWISCSQITEKLKIQLAMPYFGNIKCNLAVFSWTRDRLPTKTVVLGCCMKPM